MIEYEVKDGHLLGYLQCRGEKALVQSSVGAEVEWMFGIIILHELIFSHTPKHDATFIAYMDLYMPNWRDIRNELNNRKLDYYDTHDESPLKKLINAERYDEIKDAGFRYLEYAPDLDKKKYVTGISSPAIPYWWK